MLVDYLINNIDFLVYFYTLFINFVEVIRVVDWKGILVIIFKFYGLDLFDL